MDLFMIKDDPRPRLERQPDARLALRGRKCPLDVLVYTPTEVSIGFSPYNGLMNDIFTRGETLYER